MSTTINDQLPLVSIVIPTYNCAKYLREAIQSVLNQDYPNIELIVIDDGSKDNTPEILEEFKGQFYYESQKNMGQAATLNKGWEMAKGEYIGYLSSDDLLEPNAVSESVKAFFEHPEIILTYPNNYQINEVGKIIREIRGDDFNKYRFVETAICVIGVGAFWKKSAHKRILGWNREYKILSDYDFFLRLCELGSFYHIDKMLGLYRISSSSFTRSKLNESELKENTVMMRKFLSNTKDPLLLKNKKKILARANFVSIKLLWTNGRYMDTWFFFSEAVKLYPGILFDKRTYRTIVGTFIVGHGKREYFLHRIIFYLKNLLHLSKRGNNKCK